MKKILLPIDGSQRSIYSVEMAKELCDPKKHEIYLAHVMPGKLYLSTLDDPNTSGDIPCPILDEAAVMLAGYTVHTQVLLGSSPGVEIEEYAKKIHVDTILMTRSSRSGLRKLGSVATYLVKNATSLNLIILREDAE